MPYRAIRALVFCKLRLAIAFTAVTRVQIPSGTPNPFRGLRTFRHFFIGTNRHTFAQLSDRQIYNP
jgi:hypothetical protein